MGRRPTIDDRIAHDLKLIARRFRKPYKAIGNEALGGDSPTKVPSHPKDAYRIRSVSLGGLLLDANLDKALSLADAFDDIEIVRKLNLGK